MEKELEECTFKPTINVTSLKIAEKLKERKLKENLN